MFFLSCLVSLVTHYNYWIISLPGHLWEWIFQVDMKWIFFFFPIDHAGTFYFLLCCSDFSVVGNFLGKWASPLWPSHLGLKAPPLQENVMDDGILSSWNPSAAPAARCRAVPPQQPWVPPLQSAVKGGGQVGYERWLVCLWLCSLSSKNNCQTTVASPYTSSFVNGISCIVHLSLRKCLFSSQGCRYSAL